MLKDQIDEAFKELKSTDPKVISLIVTDDSGLVIYSNKKTEAIEVLGSVLTEILKKTKKILGKYGNNELRELVMRIEDYKIIIVPKKRTISIIIKKQQ